MGAGGSTEGSPRPNSSFAFAVDLGGGVAGGFAEASGLDPSIRPVGLRSAAGPLFRAMRMPKLGRVGDVSLKRGMVPASPAFWSLLSAIEMNTAAPRTVTIALLDAAGAAQRRWTLGNAWPTKLTGTELVRGGATVAIASIELAYETITVSGG